MAEREETITVAARLPESHVIALRAYVAQHGYRNVSDLMRQIVDEWARKHG